MSITITPHVRIFVAVVESGSITAAAEKLALAKSSVSQSLKDLENSLGTRLLNRTTRQQSLTETGGMYYQACLKIMSMAREAEEEISSALDTPAGELTITAPFATVCSAVIPALKKIRADYPEVMPRLLIDDSRLDLISNKIDVAIRLGELPDSNYRTQTVGYMPASLWVSRDYLGYSGFRQDGVSDPSEVARYRYIAQNWQGNPIQHSYRTPDGKQAKLVFETCVQCNTAAVARGLVKDGFGMALLPDILMEEFVETGEVVKALPQLEQPPTRISAIHPYGDKAPLSVRRFIDTFRAELKAE
ncbi:LysR family transcriptional regulator [Leisingera sp. SS27]|uniref:LysR family transcriptional regulator n=1 Tax=unclassified Leisingera TaxID=2614906 RepID=UPI0021A3B4B8|nr:MULTISPECIES: LysR family transcriptional regulator [unclassified Leisingera]MDC0659480.1 LysR family transcriptional regulator [Leisingera sp. SS27]UWQ81662.1 LysR family transcriptional regulator [Leisingera sp. S132]